MQKLIEFLNGKKTVIGFLCLLAAQGVKTLAPEMGAVVTALEWLGGILGSVGVVHKAVKASE